MKKVKITRFGVLHQIAHCMDCEWMEEGNLDARKLGRSHCIKTGHRVHIETGTSFDYYLE